MTPLPPTPELLQVAQNVIWFKEPEEALQDPIHFLAYAMRFGTVEDLVTLEKAGIDISCYSEVLDNAPAGILDPRSWSFWNRKCGRAIIPPLPVRRFDLR